jgi:ABC-2 type transport system permease protein
VLGGAYLLRAVADTGPTGLVWLSPVGWGLNVRAYANERWWVAGLFVGFAVLFTVAGYALVARRDVGAGLLPERLGRAEAAPSLASPFALAWRLHRGLLLGWVVALALTGAVLGGAASGIGDLQSPSQGITDILARMGGRKGLTDAFLAAIFGITGMVAAAYTVQATLRLRQEESSGRVEALLATPVGRLRWAASHLVFALLGTALLLVVAGVAGGLSYGAQVHDVGGQFGRVLGAAVVQVPAAWVLAGLGVALIGLAPRLTALTWAVLILSVLLVELGALFGLNQWVVDATPFAHVPKLPGSAFTVTPVLWLTAIAVALGAAGLAGLRRRDIPVA